MSRQMGKTKLETCIRLGISGETYDALVNSILNGKDEGVDDAQST